LEGEGDARKREVGFRGCIVAGSVAEVDLFLVVDNEEAEGGVEVHFEDSDVDLGHVDEAEANELLLKLRQGAIFFWTHKLCLKLAASRSGFSPEFGEDGFAGLFGLLERLIKVGDPRERGFKGGGRCVSFVGGEGEWENS